MPKQSRDVRIKIRATPAERDKWQAMARTADLPLSDLLRQRMEQPMVAAPRRRQRRLRTESADPAMLRQLAAIGNNLNQIARVVNSTGLKPTDTALLLSYLAGMQDELRLIREPEKPEPEGGDDAP